MALTLAQLLDVVLTRRLMDVHTAFPARVESYDAAKQVMNVQPLLKAQLRNEEGVVTADELPVLTNVPVAFPGGGGHRLTFPIKQGDTVLVVVAEASLERWQKLGGLQESEDGRRFHLADAIAIPGLHDDTKAWANADSAATTLGKDDGMRVVVTDTEVKLGHDAGQAAVKGTDFRQHLKTMHNNLASQLQQAATAAAALSSSPSGGPVVGASALQATLQAAALILSNYESNAAGRNDDLSQVVKVK